MFGFFFLCLLVVFTRLVFHFLEEQKANNIIKQHQVWKTKNLDKKFLKTLKKREIKKILVTGGCGNYGSTLIEFLCEKFPKSSITSLDLITKSSTTEQVSYHKANITNLDELTPHFKEIDAVFHTAALIDVDGPRSSLLNINLLGTQNIVECCLKNNVMALIFTSSISVNQPTTEEFNYKETSSEYKFIESYGESKRYAEELVLNANGIHGLYTAAFATIGLWGPHDPLFFNQVIKMKNPLAKIPRLDEAIQTPCFCENAAHAQILGLEKIEISNGNKYFVADEPIQNSEMKVNLWEAFHGKKAEFKIIPNGIFVSMTYFLHYARWWLQPILEFKPPVRKSYLIYSASLTLDISKIQKELGYKPLYTNKEAIKRSIEVYNNKIEKK
jgi:nucleoside-diphosphate-sugar epimerase